MPGPDWQTKTRYVLTAVAAVLVAALARALLSRYLGSNIPFLTFFPAVIAAALWGGRLGGSLATLLSTAAAIYWMEPIGTFLLVSNQDRLGLVLFVMSCIFIVLAGTRVHTLTEERGRLLTREREIRRELERASLVKDEFLATLSHELRTPLNAILGWTHLLRSPTATSEDMKQGIETVERNARIQARLIEDLLEMSRIISGKLRLDLQPLDLLPVVNDAIETIRPAAQAKKIEITCKFASEARIMGDPARLQQIAWNLLANAIKFTPKGGLVEVSIEDAVSHLYLAVRDNGVGIEPKLLPYVFDRFRQSEAAARSQQKGLGLGLAIVKNLVEMHGGRVEARSEGTGTGTTFVVTLPVHPAATAADDSGGLSNAISLEGLRVLVVDDEQDAREFVRRLLLQRGAQVEVATSVDEALARVAANAPDVLLCDIGMPGKDGYHLIREVRAQEARPGRMAAIALTAFARAEDRAKAVQAGYQMHLTKPIEAQELLTAVTGLAGRWAKERPAKNGSERPEEG